jgi:protein CpxP
MWGRLVIAVGLVAVLLTTAAAAVNAAPATQLAQAPPGAPPPQTSPPQNIEANIATLRQRLQITPGQEPQFNAVANIMRENARAEASVPQQPPSNASAVDDLRAFIRYSEVELAGLKKMVPALEALYATLSPAQRQAANAAFREGPGG